MRVSRAQGAFVDVLADAYVAGVGGGGSARSLRATSRAPIVPRGGGFAPLRRALALAIEAAERVLQARSRPPIS
jgi:hypothetical protein